LSRLELKVEGMSCDHCRMAVEKALKTIDGVTGVKVDLDTGKVSVEYESGSVNEGVLKEAVRQAGYEVV